MCDGFWPPCEGGVVWLGFMSENERSEEIFARVFFFRIIELERR